MVYYPLKNITPPQSVQFTISSKCVLILTGIGGHGTGTARSDVSRNTLGPSMTLDLDHLLSNFNQNDREDEIKQVN